VRIAITLSLLWIAFQPALAAAHQERPATLALAEREPGTFVIQWRGGDPLALRPLAPPTFPAHCVVVGQLLRCGSKGLHGAIQFEELSDRLDEVWVHIEWFGGKAEHRVVRGGDGQLELRGTPAGANGSELMAVAADYTVLGVGHILGGIDHLLFVLGLVLLTGFSRNLLWTITAFTAAHSITLVLAALEVAVPPTAPVEFVIALSILFLAVECSRAPASSERRSATFSGAVAFSFGLLHGFGFAGALADVGLPPHQTPLALLFFNVGVELGQLLAIAVLWALAFGQRRAGGLAQRARPWLVYGLGGVASYWMIERGLPLLGVG
jgi:hydrogenase/urease accessory protein HupE